MPKLSSFDYAVLRIVPRVEREEFLNAGVILLCLEQRFLAARTFIAEGRWDAVVRDLKAGDYVFIQFGHNDEVPTKATYTPADQFEANLIRFIRQSLDKQAIPVLITPVARRRFDSAGRIEETSGSPALCVMLLG